MGQKETRTLFHEGADINPCYWEKELTSQCLRENYKGEADCHEYAQNTRNCRKFWTKVIRDRKRRGITPVIPQLQDKDLIYDEYKHWLGK